MNTPDWAYEIINTSHYAEDTMSLLSYLYLPRSTLWQAICSSSTTGWSHDRYPVHESKYHFSHDPEKDLGTEKSIIKYSIPTSTTLVHILGLFLN